MVWGGEVGGLDLFEEILKGFGFGYVLEGEDGGFSDWGCCN